MLHSELAGAYLMLEYLCIGIINEKEQSTLELLKTDPCGQVHV